MAAESAAVSESDKIVIIKPILQIVLKEKQMLYKERTHHKTQKFNAVNPMGMLPLITDHLWC